MYHSLIDSQGLLKVCHLKEFNIRKKDWHLLLQAVIKQCNNAINESTKLRRVDAIHDKNAVDVKTHVMVRARFKRKYK